MDPAVTDEGQGLDDLERHVITRLALALNENEVPERAIPATRLCAGPAGAVVSLRGDGDQ